MTELTTAVTLAELRRPSTSGLVLLALLYGAFECSAFLPEAVTFALLVVTAAALVACIVYAAIQRRWLGLGLAAGLAGAVLTIPFRGIGLTTCTLLTLVSVIYAKRHGSLGARLFAAKAAFMLLLFALGFGLSSYLYYARVRTGIARGQTIVAAILSFEAREGALPDSLQALVPGWVPEIPRPGTSADPEFTYVTRDNVPHPHFDPPKSFTLYASFSGFQPWWTQVIDSVGWRRDVIVYMPESGFFFDADIGRTVKLEGHWVHTVNTVSR